MTAAANTVRRYTTRHSCPPTVLAIGAEDAVGGTTWLDECEQLEHTHETNVPSICSGPYLAGS